jgi:hypothetical protein
MNFLLDKMRAMDNSREELKLLNGSDNSSIILLFANMKHQSNSNAEDTVATFKCRG